MHYCNDPLDNKRLMLAGATVGTVAIFGLSAAFAVAAAGLTAGGIAIQAFALPICGVPRRTQDEYMGTKEALEILNATRKYHKKAELKFPKINI